MKIPVVGGSEEVELADLVERTLRGARRALPDNVGLVVDVDRDAPPVTGFPAALERLVLDLLRDACAALPDGGDVRVAVRSPAPRVVTLEVSDTGPGPGPARRSLELVRAVVERHGALVRIGSRTGGGTRVVVAFFQ
jgi:signal transduction histidine kinase